MGVSTEMKVNNLALTTAPGCESAGNGATASEAPSGLKQALGKITAADLKEAARQGVGVAMNLGVLGLSALSLLASGGAISGLGYVNIGIGIGYAVDQGREGAKADYGHEAPYVLGVLSGIALAITGLVLAAGGPKEGVAIAAAVTGGFLLGKGVMNLKSS